MSSAFRSGLPGLPRWFWPFIGQVLGCWCALVLTAGTAWATASSSNLEEPAPMCDPDGASVAARDDIPEIDRGRFEALPCEAQLLMAGWRLDSPEFGCRATSFDDRESPPPGAPQLPRAHYEAARELAMPFPERVEPTLAPRDDRDGLAPRRGHARAQFRPPVARA